MSIFFLLYTDVQTIFEAILSSYKAILDDLDPKALRQFFLDRKAIRAKDYDNLCKPVRRRHRASQLMRYITRNHFKATDYNNSLVICFLDALKICGYDSLVKLITSKAGTYGLTLDCFEIGQKRNRTNF